VKNIFAVSHTEHRWRCSKPLPLSYILIQQVYQFVYRGSETQIIFNKTVLSNLRAQKLFKTSSFYFLFLFLCSFLRSNCRRSLFLTYVCFCAAIVEGPYFLLLFLRSFSHNNCRRSLLLIFTSVFAQQLQSSMGEIFLRFWGWVRRFRCVFFGIRV